MKYLLFVLVALLTACSTAPRVPEKVEVPYPVPCKIIAPEKPTMPFDGIKKTDSIFVKVRGLLAEREVRKGYEGELEAAIKSCQ